MTILIDAMRMSLVQTYWRYRSALVVKVLRLKYCIYVLSSLHRQSRRCVGRLGETCQRLGEYR